MKTAVILLTLIGFVFGEVEEYSNGASVCELMKVDATFVTVAMQGTEEIGTSTVTTNKDSFGSGSCTNTTSTLRITFNETGAIWTLTFSLSSSSDVTVTMMLQYDAAKVFSGKNLTGNVVSAASQTPLSKGDKSYKCNAEQTIEFKEVLSGNTNYSIKVTMKDLQVQAFNVADNKFSEATECPQDAVTTTEAPNTTPSEETASTSEEPTTEASSPTTEESTSTAASTSTAPATTTTAPKAPVNTYKVQEDNKTCVLMTAAIALNVNYEKKDNKTANVMLNVPSTFTVSGACGNGSDSNATLTVKFENNTIEFMFMDATDKSEIAEITAMIKLDSTNFPNATKTSMTLSSKEVIAQSDDNTFYLCNAGDTVTFNGGSSMDITQFKVQAFNLDNGNFTGTGNDCPADSTTSTASSSSTMTPTTAAPSTPEVNNFTISDGNVTCLVMKVSLALDISYFSKDGKSTSKVVNVPRVDNSEYSGTCGNVTEELNMKFFTDGWEIQFVFADTDGVTLADDESLTAEVKNYALENVTVTYTFDGHLPDSNETVGTKKTVTASNLKMFGGAVDGSYKCDAESTIKINDVSLQVSNLRYQAFQTGNSPDFNNGDVSECDADIETNSVVPIAVGAALAGLVVIVLIAYLIGRRKSRRAGYESV